MPQQISITEVKHDISVWLHAPSSTKPLDLVPHIEEINVYEDINSPCLTATIIFNDAFNIVSKMPIVGEELVTMEIKLPGVSDSNNILTLKTPNMYVNSIEQRQMRTQQSERVAISLVSEKYMNNLHSRVSKAYCESIHLIVKDIFKNCLKAGSDDGISAEATSGIEHCVMPNWKPIDAINWLTTKARSKNNPEAVNYLYYETLNGSKFQCLDTLMNSKSFLLFCREPRNVDPTKIEGFSGAKVKADWIEVKQQFKKTSNIRGGLYASKLITHDMVTKNITQHDYNLFSNWSKITHLADLPPIGNFKRKFTAASKLRNSLAPSPNGKKPVLEGSRTTQLTDSAIMFYPKHNQLFSHDPGSVYDNEVEKWKLQRASQLKLLSGGLRYTLQCGGINFLRVGMIVNLHMLSPEAYIKYGDSTDTMISGKALVTAVRHVVTNFEANWEYKMIIDLAKDGLGGVK